MATAMTLPAPSAEATGRTDGGSMGDAGSIRKPNALENWSILEDKMKDKKVVVFLDYDGTLSPIGDQPDKAYLLDGMRQVLAEVASMFTTAIVTGRSKEKVYNFVGLDDVFYAGSHGLEIQGPLERPVKCQMAEAMRPKLEAVTVELHSRLRHIPGYEIEDNKFALSVHYRHVRPASKVEELHKIVQDFLVNEPEIVIRRGKKVLELRPKVNWNKGSAVNWILEALELSDKPDVFPMYLGDDITDEDAFLALENRSAGGMGVLVKEDFDPERPQETNASFSLRNPREVLTFLSKLVSHARTQAASSSRS